MNFKESRTGCQCGLLYAEETCQTNSRQIFSKPLKTILQIWPTDVLLKCGHMLNV